MKKIILFLSLLTALFASGQSTITVTSPNGGEIWNTGTTKTIKWTSQSVVSVDIDYSIDGGLTWTNIVTDQASTGTYDWNVNGTPSLTCLVKIKNHTNTFVFDSSKHYFIIGPISIVNAGKDTSMCAGSSLQLFADGSTYDVPDNGGGPGGPPPGSNFQWEPSASLDNPSVANPIATPASTTVYTVTITGPHGSSATDSVTVFVLPSPVLSLTPSHGTANYSVNDTIKSNVDPPGQTVSYSWTANGVNIGNNSYVTYNYPGTFECIVVNNFGCWDTAILTINGGLTITVESSSNVTCNGGNDGAINISVTGGTGNYTYNWNDQSSVQNRTDLLAGNYAVTVHDINGAVGFATVQITQPAPIQISPQLQIDGTYPDTLNVGVGGGTGPYTYLWSNNSLTSQSIIHASGNYTCTVSDARGCTATIQISAGVVAVDDHFDVVKNNPTVLQILQNDQLSNEPGWYPSVVVSNVPHHGNAITNANQSFTYTPDNNFIGVDSFYYSVCSFDSIHLVTGACDTALVHVNIFDSLIINLQQTPSSCPSTCNGSIVVTTTGGTPTYSYKWSTGSTANPVGSLCSALYSVTVTDAHGLSAVGSITLTSSSTLQIVQYGDSLYAMTNFTGNPDWTFLWSTGFTETNYGASKILVSHSGQYCVTATNNNTGCILNQCDTIGCIGCVWPGDANYDGIADNNDLLPIGLGYGKTGSPRANASIVWVGQYAIDWADSLVDGTNYKNIDCNGDGTINADDTLAILQNYGSTHMRSGGMSDRKGGAPELSITLSPDTVGAGQTMIATLSLGDANTLANNIYSLAFSFNYNPLVVDSVQTTITIGNSWLGNQTDKISIAKDLKAEGKIQMALTRIDHTTRSGAGPIALVSFVITTDNINGKLPSYYATQYWISNLVAIDNFGNVMDVNEGLASGTVSYTATGIEEVKNPDPKIHVFPNPADDQLTIEANTSVTIKEIRITGLLGNLVTSQEPTTGHRTIVDVSSLTTGTYFVEVITGNGTITKRIVVAR